MSTRLLVTGTGRCGTTWLADTLTAAGLPCGHEAVFNLHRHGEGGWVAESSWLAAPYLPVPDAYTVHLVRHPLAVIRSFVAKGTFRLRRRPYGRYAARHVPDIAEQPTTPERAAVHWAQWNLMIEEGRPDERIRIEDITCDDLRRMAGKTGHRLDLDRLPPPSNGVADLGPEVTWRQVQHIPGLLVTAERYGYR